MLERRRTSRKGISKKGEVGIRDVMLKSVKAGYCVMAGRRAGRYFTMSVTRYPRRCIGCVGGGKLRVGTLFLARKRFSRVVKVSSFLGTFPIPICTNRSRLPMVRSSHLGMSSVCKPGCTFRKTGPIGSNRIVRYTKVRISMLRAPKRAMKKYYCCLPRRRELFDKSALFYTSVKEASLPAKDDDRLIHSIGRGVVVLPRSAGVCPKRVRRASIRFRGRRGPFV